MIQLPGADRVEDKKLRIFDPRAQLTAVQKIIIDTLHMKERVRMGGASWAFISFCREMLLRTSSKDQCAQVLYSNKDSRLLWVKDDYIITTGFNQNRQQEVRLWDYRKLNSSLSSMSLATSNG
ncbi:coronin-7 [Silurus meridionalis]|nr:coronin-7 [Silurus meridionalis]